MLKKLCGLAVIVGSVVCGGIGLAQTPVGPTKVTLTVNGKDCEAPPVRYIPISLRGKSAIRKLPVVSGPEMLKVHAVLEGTLPPGWVLTVYRTHEWRILCQIKQGHGCVGNTQHGADSLDPLDKGSQEGIIAQVNAPTYTAFHCDMLVTWE